MKNQKKKPKNIEVQFASNPERYITVSISNNSYNTFELDLFSLSNLKLPDFIKLKFQESPNIETLIHEINYRPIKISGFKYFCKETPFGSYEQFSMPIYKYYKDMYGYSSKNPIRPLSAFSASQMQSNQIDFLNIQEFQIGQGHSLELTILPKTTIFLAFKINNN